MAETQTRSGFKQEYHHLLSRRIILLVVLIVGIVLFVGLFSVSAYNGIGLIDSYKILWDHITGVEYEPRSQLWWADYYIWNRALPRVIVAIVAGAALAVSGAIMQAIMNNPLADPYSTGISSGACLGAVSAILAGISFSTLAGEAGIITNAFIGALVPAIIIILVAPRVGNSPATLILLGTALSYFFNALVTYMMMSVDAEALQDAYLWQVGSLSGMTWDDVPVMLVITIVGCIFALAVSRKLNVLSLGDSSAKSLGVDVGTFRTICLIVVSVMTAAIVSFTGIIGFVGLVAPHIVRIVAGSDNRFVIPTSMLAGALLLLVADYLAMTVSTASDIPVGVIMSLIGSPIFFILIVWQRKNYGGLYRWG